MTISNSELEKLVESYLAYEFHCCLKLEDFKKMETTEDAIEISVRSRLSNGKCHSHQFRISQPTFDDMITRLKTQEAALENATDFHQIFTIFESVGRKVKGAGPLLIYDAALRFAYCYKGMEPDKVYLHAGAEIGAKALNIAGKVVEISKLPSPLRKLSALQIEDFLCVYKEKFL